MDITIPQINDGAHERLPYLKELYRRISARITKLKSTRKSCKYGYVTDLARMQYEARSINIVRGLLRGKKLEEIENKPRLETSLEKGMYQHLINGAVGLYANGGGKDNPLYVIVNTTLGLDNIQTAVQSGHAIAAMLLENKTLPWKNGVLKFLDGRALFGPVKADHESNVNEIFMAEPSVVMSMFREPDLDGACTALAVFSPNGHLPYKMANLPLLKLADPAKEVSVAVSRGSVGTPLPRPEMRMSDK